MTKKLKLMTIVGTRPEIIKMSESIKLFDTAFDHVLVHTGQNYDYELNQVFFDDLGLREPDFYLGVVGNDLGETMGNILSKSYTLMRDVRPDALIVLGDTNSCLCVISAKRLKIPIFHMEAGNRCFDENLPEEVNRRIVDTTSDVNLCYSEHARRNLLTMGCAVDRTFVVGSPMREVLDAHRKEIESSDVLEKLGLEQGGYLLLSAHREENVDHDRALGEMASAVNALADEYRIPILYSMHPRSKRRIEEQGIQFHSLVKPHKPFSFSDYVNLQLNALCVVSDSGTLAEESAILGFPAVSLRTSSERPEAIDAGAMIQGGVTARSVLQAVEMATHLKKEIGANVSDYASRDISHRLIRIIQGYTDYTNSNVWKNL